MWAELSNRSPRLLEKLHRPLLRRGWGMRRRLQVLRGHYQLTGRLFHLRTLQAIYLQPGLLLGSFDSGQGKYELWLAGAGRNEKEGELGLYWRDRSDGLCLAQLSFSLLDAPGGCCLYLGGLQGPAGEAAKERVRQAGKHCHGLRPKRAVLEGLFALAAHIGATEIRAVSNRYHVCRSWRVRRAVQYDYDAFWQELGATLHPDGDFLLPLQPLRRSADEVATRKRAEHRRRQALLDHLHSQTIRLLQSNA